MQILVIFKGDVNFARDFLLKKPDNTAYDLTGHTANFKMTTVYGGTAKINAAATIVSPATEGRIRYTFIGTDTDTTDRYHAEVETTETSSGKVLTWRLATVEIRPTV